LAGHVCFDVDALKVASSDRVWTCQDVVGFG
jgi:hypothetical protein